MTVMLDNSTLGARLVAFRDVALCDRADHEVAIVTDGHTAYAWGIGTQSTDAGTVVRVSVALSARCQQPTGHDGEPCDGLVTWTLDTAGCWGADADALATLAAFGQAVER